MKAPVGRASREGAPPRWPMAAFSRRPHVAKSRGEQASPWDLHVGTLPSCPNRPPETLPASATTLRGGIATHTLGRTQTFRPEHVASCNRHRGGHAGTGRPSEETRRGRDGGVGTVRQPVQRARRAAPRVAVPVTEPSPPGATPAAHAAPGSAMGQPGGQQASRGKTAPSGPCLLTGLPFP